MHRLLIGPGTWNTNLEWTPLSPYYKISPNILRGAPTELSRAVRSMLSIRTAGCSPKMHTHLRGDTPSCAQQFSINFIAPTCLFFLIFQVLFSEQNDASSNCDWCIWRKRRSRVLPNMLRTTYHCRFLGNRAHYNPSPKTCASSGSRWCPTPCLFFKRCSETDSKDKCLRCIQTRQ